MEATDYKPMNACKMKGKDFAKVMDNAAYLVQEKYKGIRAFARTSPEGTKILSRGGNYVEQNFPHLAKIKGPLRLFDCELYQRGVEDEVVAGWANSKYLDTSCTAGVQLASFDLLYMSVSLIQFTLEARLAKLALATTDFDPSLLFEAPIYPNNHADDLFAEVVARGGEGLMFKNRYTHYMQRTGDNRPANHWYKLKAEEDHDVIITGYTEGNGKYEGYIGAIQFGQYVNGELWYIGKCSGMDDHTRFLFTENRDTGGSFLGRVIEVRCAGQDPKSLALIEPRFIRFRDDKRPEECIYAK